MTEVLKLASCAESIVQIHYECKSHAKPELVAELHHVTMLHCYIEGCGLRPCLPVTFTVNFKSDVFEHN